MKLEKTYRNAQSLLDIAGKFITKNPNQIEKNMKSNIDIDYPIKIVKYPYPYQENKLEEIFIDSYGVLANTGDKEIDYAKEAIKLSIEDIVIEFGEETDIAFLGRTKYDLIKENEEFKIKNINGDIHIKYKKYPKLKIRFFTIHKSKGLEFTNVILTIATGKLGLPNMIVDDRVLRLVSCKSDDFEFSEERRLFYVALTRTRNRIYLLYQYYRFYFCS